MSQFSTLRYFATAPHPCSYLDAKEATTIFVDPDVIISDGQYRRLNDAGFRRSGKYIYRPQCKNCSSCISIRVLISSFKPRRIQKRTINKNLDVSIDTCIAKNSDEHYNLYKKYIIERHSMGDMYPQTPEQFNAFLVASRRQTFFLEARLNSKLIAVTNFDIITERGLSAIYTFFDPDSSLKHRSLGRLMILNLISIGEKMNLSYLYLGYWIQESEKMNYKTEYKPLEMLIGSKWIQVT